MRIWLSAAVAASVLVLAMAGIASASNSHGHGHHEHGHGHDHGHGHGKPDLPPIDTSNAANCDFIAEPGNALCLLPFPDDYYTRPDAASPTGRRVDLTTEGMPANALGVHIDATPYNASDGFSPGRDDPAQGAGDRHHGRRSRDRRGADQPPAPVPALERAGRRDRRDDREALADLGRDRLQRHRSGEGGPRDPPGGQLRPPPPLHRRPPRPPQRRRRTDRSARRVPLLPRQRPLQAAGDQRPPQALQGHLQDPAPGRDRPARPLPGLGLHRRQRPEQRRPRALRCATTPSPSSATPTSPT